MSIIVFGIIVVILAYLAISLVGTFKFEPRITQLLTALIFVVAILAISMRSGVF